MADVTAGRFRAASPAYARMAWLAAGLTVAMFAACGMLLLLTRDYQRAVYGAGGVVTALVCLVVGLVVAQRQPGSPIGWLLLGWAWADSAGRRDAAVFGTRLPYPSRRSALRSGGGGPGIGRVPGRGVVRAGGAAVPGRPVTTAPLALGAVGVPGRVRSVHGPAGRRAGARRPAAPAADRAVRRSSVPAGPGRGPRCSRLDRRRSDPSLLAVVLGPPGGQLPAFDRESPTAAEVAHRRGWVLCPGHRGHDLRRELLLRRCAGRPGRGRPRRGGAAGRDWRGDREVPALRHRPDHQPDARVCHRHRPAGRHVPRPGTPGEPGPAVVLAGRGGGLDAGRGGAVPPASPAGSDTWWTGGSTGPATTPTRSSPRSRPACRTPWTWVPFATNSPAPCRPPKT